MDKFARSFRKNVVEHSYRLLSVANLTVNKLARPTAHKAHAFFQESLQEDHSSPKFVNSLKKNLKESVELGHNLAITPLERLGKYLDESVKDREARLRQEYGINTDQWLFSMENLQMLEKINDLTDLTFKEVQHIKKYNSIRYLNAWAVLQKLYLISHNSNTNSESFDFPKNYPKVLEFKQIQQECLYYSTFANGAYGKFLNSMYNEKKPLDRLIKYTNYTEDFIFHTKIADSDVLHSFWETTPYKPAHVIARDQFNKGIMLCMRGTHHWADAATDLDFHYLSFSLMKEAHSDKMFLKFHYNEESQEYLKRKLGDDTRELNGEVIQPLTGNEVVLETGYAHAGMLVSAIGAYKEITPKLEEIFSKPDHSDYNLSITGHSLGGGMETLMVLLYMVHPLKAVKDKVDQKIRGYSYGGASVLSKGFDKYMKEMMKTVVLGYDVVPRLSYGSISDLCKIMLAFDEINVKNPDVIAEVLKIDTNFTSASELQNSGIEKFTGLYKDFKQNHMDSLKLFPMGRVFHIEELKPPIRREDDFYDYIMREIEQKEFFDEIVFSRHLIKHHFPHLYEGSLASSKMLYQKYMDKEAKQEGTGANPTELRKAIPRPFPKKPTKRTLKTDFLKKLKI